MITSSIEDAYKLCGVRKEIIIHYIEEDWIKPTNSDIVTLDEEDIARIRLIRELTEDFGVNEEAMPIILQLLDQLNRLYLEIERKDQIAI